MLIAAQAGHSSLLFVQNNGQFDPHVRFQLRRGTTTWWFTADGVWLTVLDFSRPIASASPDALDHSVSFEDQVIHGVNLKLSLAGMSPSARLAAAASQPTRMNYFIGRGDTWRSNVPTFGEVHWNGVYPGLNLTFAGANQGLTVLADTRSDSDVSALRLRVEGADTLWADADGNLIASTAIGAIRLPSIWTTRGTVLQPQVGKEEITFVSSTGQKDSGPSPDHGKDNRPRPDSPIPSVNWTTYLGNSGSSGDDVALGMALDSSNNVYLTGPTTSASFPTTSGAFDTSLGGTQDAFVSKLSSDGSSLSASTYLGGSATEFGYGIAIDSNGDIVVTGATNSSNFPLSNHPYQSSLGGSCSPTACADVFISKLNSGLTTLGYSSYLGGSGGESFWHKGGHPLAVDSNGYAYITGGTESNNYPNTITSSSYQGATSNHPDCLCDVFVTKIKPDDSITPTSDQVAYSTYLAAVVSGPAYYAHTGEDYGHAITVDSSGNAHVTGYTYSTDFKTTSGAYNADCGGNQPQQTLCSAVTYDAFITKLYSNGTIAASTYFGGTNPLPDGWPGKVGEVGNSITLTSAGNAVEVVGWTYDYSFPTTTGVWDTGCGDNGTCDGTLQTGYRADVFVIKMDSSLTTLQQSTFLGGGNHDDGYSIALDSSDRPTIVGWAWSSNFPTTTTDTDQTFNGTCPSGNGGGDAFVSKLSADFSSLLYSTYLGPANNATGSTCDDAAFDVRLNSAGTSTYVVGRTQSNDFPTSSGAYDTTFGNGTCTSTPCPNDVFVLKLTFP